jgi:hypothetical protein
MDSAGKMVICCTVGIALLHAIYGGRLVTPGLGFCRLKHVLEKLCDLGKPCTLDKYKLDEGDDKPQRYSQHHLLRSPSPLSAVATHMHSVITDHSIFLEGT